MKPKFAVAFLVFLTSVITGVLLPFSASAATVYDNNIQQQDYPMVLGNPSNGQTHSVASAFEFGEKLVAASWTGTNCSGKKDMWLDRLTSDDYSYMILSAVTGTYRSVQIYSWLKEDQDVEIEWEANANARTFLHVNHPSTESITGVYGFTSGLSVSGNCWSNSNFPIDTAIGQPSGTRKILEYSGFVLTYPEGYEGLIIEPATDPSLPKFGYTISDSKLSAMYLRNLDLDTTANLYKWTYRLYQTTDDYDIEAGTLLDTKSLWLTEPYGYTVPSHTYYVLKISLTVIPPAAPRTDIKNVTFQIDYTSGGLVSGSTELNECDDSGLCAPSVIKCEFGDIFQRMNCEMQRSLSMGVINPSITAFKNLLLAFTVPSNPVCSVPLSNVAIGTSTFPLSGYSSQVCSTAATFRGAFPLVAVAANFLFAMGIFVMIAAMVNRLTNKDKNNLIEGV